MTRKDTLSLHTTTKDVCTSVDKGSLRIQFSRAISKALLGKRQAYLYLNLSDTPENRLVAERIAARIQNDIYANKLEPELKAYLPVSQLKKEVGILYDPHRIKLSTLELFELFLAFYRPQLSESTYLDQYEGCFRKFLTEAPQDLNQQHQIVDFLFGRCASRNFVGTCNLLFRMVVWAQKRDLISPDAKNLFQSLWADYKVVHRHRQPGAVIKAIKPNYHKDPDYIAFSPNDAASILLAFEKHAEKQHDSTEYHSLTDSQRQIRINISDMIHFNFWTGCRICEASGLRWLDIDDDFSAIHFRHAYCIKLGRIKALKNEYVGEEGTKSRLFPAGPKLANLLASRKKLYYRGNPFDFVFPYRLKTPDAANAPINTNHVREHWYGRKATKKKKNGESNSKLYVGVVAQLLADDLISQYLKAYATRHTWITCQLAAGVPIKNVAKLAGNTPEVILKNYAGFVDNFELAPELGI